MRSHVPKKCPCPGADRKAGRGVQFSDSVSLPHFVSQHPAWSFLAQPAAATDPSCGVVSCLAVTRCPWPPFSELGHVAERRGGENHTRSHCLEPRSAAKRGSGLGRCWEEEGAGHSPTSPPGAWRALAGCLVTWRTLPRCPGERFGDSVLGPGGCFSLSLSHGSIHLCPSPSVSVTSFLTHTSSVRCRLKCVGSGKVWFGACHSCSATVRSADLLGGSSCHVLGPAGPQSLWAEHRWEGEGMWLSCSRPGSRVPRLKFQGAFVS